MVGWVRAYVQLMCVCVCVCVCVRACVRAFVRARAGGARVCGRVEYGRLIFAGMHVYLRVGDACRLWRSGLPSTPLCSCPPLRPPRRRPHQCGDPWAQDPISMDLPGYRQRYYEVGFMGREPWVPDALDSKDRDTWRCSEINCLKPIAFLKDVSRHWMGSIAQEQCVGAPPALRGLTQGPF
jgi:hypothetical protein